MTEYIVEVSEWVIDANGNPPFGKSGPIVRCRDCMYYEPNIYSHFTCELLQFAVKPGSFCSFGERREA